MMLLVPDITVNLLKMPASQAGRRRFESGLPLQNPLESVVYSSRFLLGEIPDYTRLQRRSWRLCVFGRRALNSSAVRAVPGF